MKVQILLSMRDARAFLADQIDSLIWQEHRPWHILVRDAGSTDDSIAIVHRYDLRIAPQVIQAPASGPNEAAFAILRQAAPQADLWAFCGGGDLWHEDKLARAVRRFAEAGDRPMLYCTRARIIAHDGVFMGLSPLYPRSLPLLRLLLEPAVIGTTMVVNAAARELILRADADQAPFWPWGMALAVAAAGGDVVHEPLPLADVRLHPGRWEAHAQGLSDPAAATGFDARLPLRFLRRHLDMVRALQGRDARTAATVAALEAALRDKAARRALADSPDLDDGPIWRTLRLRRMIRRSPAP